MTKEEKITEVMGLVNLFALLQADAREDALNDRCSNAQVNSAYETAKRAHGAVESKLRELIKDDQ